MGLRFRGLERVLLALFVASGFAGLIYQAIWSHYLGLSLGHAAYAQTLVLAIFMGGMALGAWLISRYGQGWRRLILAYAAIEVAIGIAGLGFHPVFMAYTGFSQDAVYPALSSSVAVSAWQWGSAALLIAPQSILLGMTFPLMSGGYLRVAPGADGEILGGLYFSNSVGAAMGALAATFLLLPWVGMPGSMAIAGGVNIAVGVLAWLVSRRADLATTGTPVAAPSPAAPADRGFRRMMLVAAGITGASSFVYEIGWVRLLNQALGTTVHSFELMLSAFILGLAFGGLWIRKRSQRIGDAVAYAGYAQLFMGIAALVSIPVFSQSFRWVGAMVEALPKTEAGYTLFSLGSGGIALLVMFPAAFFAGMTLPLFTMALLRRGAGESSIGQVYAANTLGAILGVVLAVHVLIPVLGLRLAVTLAALADIVLGVVLLRLHATAVARRPFVAAVAACVLVLGLSLLLGRLDPRALASGVFRHGQSELAEDTRIHYVRDGKTATIAVYSQGSVATIATNGKPDASLEMDPDVPAVADEITMLMAAALPLTIHPQPRDIAIIGWGSGLTTHTVLGSGIPRVVDSIEIERAMYDGARLYADRVARAYEDPRSRLHIDDARTYFSTGKKRYDVIISEPSNPWVSGVSSLFTRQFYRFLGNHLNEDGILIQWLQSYELDDQLLATMLAALHEEFPHIDVYLTNSADLLFVSSANPLPALDAGRVVEEELASELARVGLGAQGDFGVRRIGSQDLLGALVKLSGAEPHSDFHPVVSLEAPKARFMGSAARQLLTLMSLGMPVLEMTDGRSPVLLDEPVKFASTSIGSELHWVAGGVRAAMVHGNASTLEAIDPAVAQHVAKLRALSLVSPADSAAWLEAAAVVAEYSLGHLREPDLQGLWINPTWIDQSQQPDDIRSVLAAYSAVARRDAAAMQRDARIAFEALGDDAPALVKEHLLTIMLLGALQASGPAEVATIERQYGGQVPPSSSYGLARAYLLAWADREQP
jgi:spermidine synthase